jgi:hypothetical protein
MSKEKKEWRTPELVVLVRGRPEEAVLQQCKGGTHSGTLALYNGCAAISTAPYCNVICQSLANS